MGAHIAHRAAVLGSPIAHSRSPLLHNAGYRAAGLTDWHYGRFECTDVQLPTLITSLDESYQGFSVTMPAKFAALRFATSRTERAEHIGAANTLLRVHDGWRADNTDVDGVYGALAELGVNLAGEKVLVVGGGGTARPVLWALSSLGVAHITVINRTDKSAELAPMAEAHGVTYTLANYDADLCGIAREAALVVSTVPAQVVEPYAEALVQTPVFDVIYEPWPTPLVRAAQQRDMPVVGGHVMLAHQAYGQFEQFTGVAAPKQAMWEALLADLV